MGRLASPQSETAITCAIEGARNGYPKKPPAWGPLGFRAFRANDGECHRYLALEPVAVALTCT